MKKIKPPFLSTSFSESGKSAKRRFTNILNSKKKKAGAAIVAIALTGALCFGAAVACIPEEIQITPEHSELARELYELRTENMEAESMIYERLMAITNALKISDELGDFSMEMMSPTVDSWAITNILKPSDMPEYAGNEDLGGLRTITLAFEEPFESMDSFDCHSKMMQYQALIMALAPEVGTISWRFSITGISTPVEYYVKRTEDEDEAGKSLESFEKLVESAYSIIDGPTVMEVIRSGDSEMMDKYTRFLHRIQSKSWNDQVRFID